MLSEAQRSETVIASLGMKSGFLVYSELLALLSSVGGKRLLSSHHTADAIPAFSVSTLLDMAASLS
ncbi:hypothetical protein KIPB_015740, partial [Kipferlia bialata]|eukprot:g15740.t1